MKINFDIKLTKKQQEAYNLMHEKDTRFLIARWSRQCGKTIFAGFFKGVSTKYLNNYIVWNSLVNFAKETYQEKAALFLNFVLTATLTERFEDVANRPPLPK